jgi:TPR repeat protein
MNTVMECYGMNVVNNMVWIKRSKDAYETLVHESSRGSRVVSTMMAKSYLCVIKFIGIHTLCPKNEIEARREAISVISWLKEQSLDGNMFAQSCLGHFEYIGVVDSINYDGAFLWYQKSADQGHAGAQCFLGICYDAGRGVGQDHVMAVEWYQMSADQGNATAQCCLGACYDAGRGVGQDHVVAAEWYQKSADQGKSVLFRYIL